MIEVTLVSAPTIDWESFLRATITSRYHPAKGVDSSKVRNNAVYNFLIGITTVNNLRDGVAGKLSREALRHCSFSFVINAPTVFFSEVDLLIKMHAVTTQFGEHPNLIGILTGDLFQFKNLITVLSRNEYVPNECVEVANKLLLKFEQIGFSQLWAEYRKVPSTTDGLSNSLFYLEVK